MGPSLLNIVPSEINESLALIKVLGLGIIAFILGGELEIKRLKVLGKSVLGIAFFVVLFTFALVYFALVNLTDLTMPHALLLAAMATATSPATVIVVSKEVKAKGSFTSTLMGVVAITDMFSVMTFGVASAVVFYLKQDTRDGGITSLLKEPVIEIAGSFILGALVGVVLTYILKYLKDRHQVLVIIVGFLLFNSAVSEFLHFSPLLTNMFMGFVLANLHKTPSRIIQVLNDVELPIFVVFFALAGASLALSTLWENIFAVVVYFIARLIARVGGAYLGALCFGGNSNIRKYTGISLLAKAGLSIGLVVIVQSRFPELAPVVTAVELSIVAICEITTPPFLKYSYIASGEAAKK